MKRTTPEPEMIAGFWLGSHYGDTGVRWDYVFDLLSKGSYHRGIRREDEDWKTEEGSWNYDGTLHLKPSGLSIGPTDYFTHLVMRLEVCRYILVIRPVISGSLNLPTMLYRDSLRTLEAWHRENA